MPSRRRDYKAEEARRNARAKAAGFTSRAQMRKALREKETVVARDRRGTIVGRAQGPVKPVWAEAGYSTAGMYKAERQAARQWSDRHSHQPTSRWLSSFQPVQAKSYYDAYVNPDTRAAKTVNELYSLREYLVDVMGYYTDDEFDERYNTL